MTTISPEQEVFTLINVFTVEPAQQQRLVETLIETTESLVKHLPGFVSASVHKSLDGTRVVNYGQWKNKEAFDIMRQSPEVQKRMGFALQLGQSDGHFYTVASVSNSSDG
jgi:quinol monooxygenase YgiN